MSEGKDEIIVLPVVFSRWKQVYILFFVCLFFNPCHQSVFHFIIQSGHLSRLWTDDKTENRECVQLFFFSVSSWCNNSFYLLVNGTSVGVKSATICEDLISCFKHHRRMWGHYYTFIWPEIFHLLFRIITFPNHSLSLEKLLFLYGLIKYK